MDLIGDTYLVSEMEIVALNCGNSEMFCLINYAHFSVLLLCSVGNRLDRSHATFHSHSKSTAAFTAIAGLREPGMF